jgi:hypothetical protein
MERKNKIVTKKRTVSTAGKKIAKPKTYSGFANKAIRSGIGKKVTSTKKIKKTNKNKIGDNYAEYLEGVQQKYESTVNFNINEDIEEKKINKTSQYLKEIILQNHPGETEKYYIPGSLAEFFSKDQKFREYFDDVYYLNEEINKRQRDIQKEKEKELEYYRNKFKRRNLNRNNMEENINEINSYIKPDKDKKQTENNNDLFDQVNDENRRNMRKMIFCALFGNGTPM